MPNPAAMQAGRLGDPNPARGGLLSGGVVLIRGDVHMLNGEL
jgi:hypothetical protein